MSAPAEKLAREALALSARERAELAHRLIASLDESADASATAAAEAAGKAEALRRLGEIERGEVQPISQDELWRRVRGRLSR